MKPTRGYTTVAVLALCTAGYVPGAAAELCSSYSFTPIFCDDFDTYCDPPPGSGSCAPGSTANNTAFHTVWPADGTCAPVSTQDFLESGSNAKGMFSPRCGQDREYANYDRIYRHVHNLAPDIAGHPGNLHEADKINGAGAISLPLAGNAVPSDYVDSMSSVLRPQSLKGTFYFFPLPDPTEWGRGAFANMIYYHELFLDNDRAPTDFTSTTCPWFNDCNCNALHPGTKGCSAGEQATCDGGVYNGTACTSDDQCTGTSQPILRRTDGQVHASFAIGLMSIYDSNPCDLDQGWGPAEWRLVVYDGQTWQTFKATLFDIPLTSPADIADFFPLYVWNRIDFAIGADDIEVRLTNIQSQALNSGVSTCVFHTCKGGTRHGAACNTDADCADPADPAPAKIPNPYWVARVPRKYKGAFNRYALGPGQGRDVTNSQNPGPYECMQAFAKADVLADEIVLYDGVFVSPNGACCGLDATCSDAHDIVWCQQQNGQFKGPNTSCADTLCCPVPFADADQDHDVDQADFARLQACLTGNTLTVTPECRCFDRVDDDHIDALDLAAFIDCATGPGIPWSQGAAPSCSPAMPPQ